MRKPSPSMVVALLALFIAMGGVSVAATGGNFILGQSNTATTSSSLSAPVAGGKALQVTNNDTSNAASTALGLNVASGHAPFTVNTGIKVAGLNADKLDGFDSSYFLPKTGTVADSSKLGGKLPSAYQTNLQALWRQRGNIVFITATYPSFTTVASLALPAGTWLVLTHTTLAMSQTGSAPFVETPRVLCQLGGGLDGTTSDTPVAHNDLGGVQEVSNTWDNPSFAGIRDRTEDSEARMLKGQP